MPDFKVDAAFRTLRKRHSRVAVCVLCRSTRSPGRPTKEALQEDELNQLPLRFNKGYAKLDITIHYDARFCCKCLAGINPAKFQTRYVHNGFKKHKMKSKCV